MGNFDYKAFISYNHADIKTAAWLQRSLETFRVPARLIGKKTQVGKISRRVGTIFRDQEELSAGGALSDTLNDALANSEFLIVICSPAARGSQWVDLEIAEFKKHHDASKILCLIADGEPLIGEDLKLDHLECYPRALGYLNRDTKNKVASESIAADYRKGCDGKRLTKLKMVSGLLGVKLDELIQREAQRRQRNWIIATFTSAAGMLAFAAISFLAIDARNDEELRRAEAEDLIEFMLSDLRDRLDAVGRLDVLDAVGAKAIEYYSNVSLTEHSSSSLGRRARAFHLLGEVDDLKGDLESARIAFEEAFQSTEELLQRDPDNGEKIYNHAQSVYWVGYLDWELGKLDDSLKAFETYLEMATQLVEIDPENMLWLEEKGNANINLGVYLLDISETERAQTQFLQARNIYQEVSLSPVASPDIKWLIAQTSAYLADSDENLGNYEEALSHRENEIELYDQVLAEDPSNQSINLSLLVAYNVRGRLQTQLGLVEEAMASLNIATETGEFLNSLDPDNTFTIANLAEGYLMLSRLLVSVSDDEEARDILGKAEAQINLPSIVGSSNQDIQNLRNEILVTKQSLFSNEL